MQLAKRQLAVAVASALFQPGFVWDLSKGSIVPARGATWANVTHTRATVGTFDDQDSMVRTALSGEARFRGLRRVQNNVVGSENIAVTGASTSGGTGTPATCTAGFTAPDGSATAFRVQANIGAGTLNADFSAWQITATVRVGSVWIKSNTGVNQNVLTAFTGTGNTVLATPTWQRLTWTNPGPASALVFGALGNLPTSKTIDVLVWHPQSENDQGQAVPIAAEYVSTGVLAAPFQGAAVDGVQYFPTHNGNVVQQNLILQSQAIDDAAWTKRGVVAVTPNATAAPDGTLTADLISGVNVAGVDDFFNAGYVAVTAAPNVRYTPSFYIKRVSTVGTLQIGNPSNGNTLGQWRIDLSLLSNGWERITESHPAVTIVVPFMSSPTGNGVGMLFNASAGGPLSFYLWGAQANNGRRAGTYVATTAAAVNNNIVEESIGDTISGNPGYFREDGRVNLFLRSDNFSATWVLTDTANNPDVTTSPDGSINADRLDEGVAGTAQTVQAVTGTANANYAISGWFKKNTNNDWIQLGGFNGANSFRAWFNLNTGVKGSTGVGGTGAIVTSAIVAYPNGWYRCIVAGSVGSAATAITGFFSSTSADNVTTRVNNASYFAWGQQFEDNQSWPSSYLPTTIATVTRNTDVLLCSGLGAYFTADASWYAEVISDQTVLSNPRVIGVTGVKGVLAHNSSVPIAGPGSYGASLWDNAAATSSVNTVNTGVLAKMCSKYTVGVNAAKVCLNGGAMVAGNTNAFSGETTIGVGTTNAGGATGFYGVIRKIHGWQRQLPDAYMQRITT